MKFGTNAGASAGVRALDVAINNETGEVIIDNVPMRPCGSGTNLPDVLMDDAKAVFDTLLALNDEVFRLRQQVLEFQSWVSKRPRSDP